MVEKVGSATPIVALTDEEIDRISLYVYNELKQTVTRLLLTLSRYGLQYDLMVDSMSLVLGELISMQVDAEKINRSVLEVAVIDRILDRGREMKIALAKAKNVPTMQEAIGGIIREVVEENKKINEPSINEDNNQGDQA